MDISIIIPTYNVAPYIIECLESVASQTYQGVIECIVVDDCGTDESIPLAQEFIDSYKGNIKFRICHREKMVDFRQRVILDSLKQKVSSFIS